MPISSEIELLFALCRAPIVGLTGSSGKSTTTTLVGEILKAAGRRVYVGGNLGTPLIDSVEEMTPDDWWCSELSRFQLEAMRRSPHVAAILNITPNHLDRHPSMEHYAESKRNIIRYQRPGDWAMLGYANELTRAYGRDCRRAPPLLRRRPGGGRGRLHRGRRGRAAPGWHDASGCSTWREIQAARPPQPGERHRRRGRQRRRRRGPRGDAPGDRRLPGHRAPHRAGA